MLLGKITQKNAKNMSIWSCTQNKDYLNAKIRDSESGKFIRTLAKLVSKLRGDIFYKLPPQHKNSTSTLLSRVYAGVRPTYVQGCRVANTPEPVYTNLPEAVDVVKSSRRHLMQTTKI